MKISPEKQKAAAVLAAAIAVGASLASPPDAGAQSIRRHKHNDAMLMAQRPIRRNQRPNQNRALRKRGVPGKSRPRLNRAQRAQRPNTDRRPARPLRDRRRLGKPDDLRSRPWQKVPQQRRQEVLHFIEERFPRLWVEMNRLHKDHPDRFRRRMRRIFPDILRMMEVTKRNPQMGTLMIRERQLDMRIRQAAFRFHKAQDTAKQQKLRRQLHQLVGEVFDVQLQRRALEITSLESRLADLKNRLAGQKELRNELIKQREQELLESRPPGKWNDDQHPRQHERDLPEPRP